MLFPAQHRQHAPHPARSRLQEAVKLFLMSWHAAWLSPLEGKQLFACGARMLMKGKKHHPAGAAGRASLPGGGSACTHLGSSAELPPRRPSFAHSQGRSLPLSPCLLPRKPQNRKDEDVLKGHLV